MFNKDKLIREMIMELLKETDYDIYKYYLDLNNGPTLAMVRIVENLLESIEDASY